LHGWLAIYQHLVAAPAHDLVAAAVVAAAAAATAVAAEASNMATYSRTATTIPYASSKLFLS